MAAKPLYFGIEQVLQAYDNSASMYWSLFDKTAKLTQYNGEGADADKAEGRERLEQLLKSFKNNGFDHDLNLHLHSKFEDAYEWKSKVTDQFIFNLFNPSERAPEVVQGANKFGTETGYEKMNNFLISENQVLREKVSQLEAQNILLQSQLQEYEEEEEEESISGTGADQVTEILSNPVIAGLIDRIFPPAPAVAGKVSHLAGVEPDKAKIDQLIQVLISKGVTVAHLEKLAAMPAAKIQNLLQWL